MKIGFCFGDPSFSGVSRLSEFLYTHRKEDFEPVIIGSEPIYTAALSHSHPELIDRYPVYTLPIGMVVRGEVSAAGGENSARAIKAALRFLGLKKIDLLLADGLNRESLALYDPQKADLFSLITSVFPGASVGISSFLSPGSVTLYQGLPGPVLEGNYEDCLSVLKQKFLI